jgi:hypothetical protein
LWPYYVNLTGGGANLKEAAFSYPCDYGSRLETVSGSPIKVSYHALVVYKAIKMPFASLTARQRLIAESGGLVMAADGLV